MVRKRVSENKSKEIKRLYSLGLSKRKIAKALGVHRRTVDRHLEFKEQKASHSEKKELRDKWYNNLDWNGVTSENLKGVPANVLWEELKDSNQVPVSYCNFLRHLKKHLPPQIPVTMHRVFKPGERIEIDYCDGIDVYDPISGEIRKTHLFVGVLCHSRYTFAEFSFSQKSEDFLESHKKMFEFFGGVSNVISPDNLKSAVTKSHRYDPDINQGYAKLAEYYSCAVVPARVRKPKDKAIVERAVQIFQRWYYYKVRKVTFTSISQLNQSLNKALTIFNEKTHRIFRRSRNEMFLEEKPYLKPLPNVPYQVQTHRVATLHPDCHFSFDKNFYSAPHTLRGKKLDLWISNKAIEVYYDSERVAFHNRYYIAGKYVTKKEHYPDAHRAYWDTTAKAIRTKASKAGVHTSKLIHQLLSGENPLRYLRRCQGIVRLIDRYGAENVDKACEKSLFWERYHLPFIERLLKTPALLEEKNRKQQGIKRGENPYLRGRAYFEQGEDNDRKNKRVSSTNETIGNDINS